MGEKYSYTVSKAIEDLGGEPTEVELQRLAENFHSYKLPHRDALIKGIAAAETVNDIVARKFQAKGIIHLKSKQQKGGHVGWVTKKLKWAVLRLLYLRYRIDEGLTRRQANQKLTSQFGSSKNNVKDPGSNIRKATRNCQLDVK